VFFVFLFKAAERAAGRAGEAVFRGPRLRRRSRRRAGHRRRGLRGPFSRCL